jgi:hypothetical protein
MQKKGIENSLFKDKSGERHGRLIITGKAPGSRKAWYVRCDCGVEKVILYHNLRTTTSCGCWKAEGKYQTDNSGVGFGESTRFLKLDEYKRGASSRGLTWNLDDKDFDKLTSSNCHYCDIEPNQVVKSKYNKGDFVYNGIDRVDNTKGYEPDNCVPCCKVCNRAKDTMTEQEFLDWVGRVHNHASRKTKTIIRDV